MKYFDTSHHFERERRAVRCNNRGIVFAGFARRILPAVRSSILRYILTISGCLSVRLCCKHRAGSGTERGCTGSDSCLREEFTARYHNLFGILSTALRFDSDALAAAPIPLDRMALSPGCLWF